MATLSDPVEKPVNQVSVTHSSPVTTVEATQSQPPVAMVTQKSCIIQFPLQ